jgi:predicted acyltransferase
MTVAGREPTARLARLIIGYGAVCAIAGWALSPILPMVKMIWSPTFVLFTGGWAMIAFGLCYLLIDVRQVADPLWPVQVFGRNAILAYVLSEFAAIALSMVTVSGSAFPVRVTALMANGAGIPLELASLVRARVTWLTPSTSRVPSGSFSSPCG